MILGNTCAVTEYDHAEGQVDLQLRRLGALREIDQAIASNSSLIVTLDLFLAKVMAQLHVDAADVLLINQQTKTLDYAAGRGFCSSAITQARFALGEGIPGRAALEGRIVEIHDTPENRGAVSASSQALVNEGFVAQYALPLVAKGQVKGVLEVFHRAPLNPDSSWLDFMEILAGQAAIAIDNAEMFDHLQRSHTELTLAYDTTLEGWSRALDLRDKETRGHSQRVAAMTVRLARAMGIDEAEIVHIRRGALLHDIGKMGIPDLILLKPGPLTDAEWEIMREHPNYAHTLLSPIPYLGPALDIPRYHHEKWDGSGYPFGLRGEEIPLSARIFAVVDVHDALRSDHPYRMAWSEDQVITYIGSMRGIHFDPRALDAFLKLQSEDSRDQGLHPSPSYEWQETQQLTTQ